MNPSIRIGEWILTPASHRLVRGDTTHVLRPKLVQILEHLAAEPGRVIERDELLDRVWPGIVVTDDSVTRGISDLRKLLGDSAEAPRYIETIRKGGYRLVAPVSAAPCEPGAGASQRRAPAAGTPQETESGHGSRRLAAAGAVAAGTILALTLYLHRSAGEEAAAADVRLAEPRPFTTLVGRETDPAMSPDGRRVAFAWGGVRSEDYDIWVQGIDADAPRRLTSGPAADHHPAWSPDGERVAFLRTTRDGSSVFVVPSTGGEAESLHTRTSWLSGLDWSPAGDVLVFAGREDDGGFRIHRLLLDERRTTPVSRPPAQHTDHSPVFSPDGTSLAFVRSAMHSARDRIVVTGVDDAPRMLDVAGLSVRGLDWVADTAHLVLAAEVGETARLFRLRVADGELTEVPVREERVTYPSLSRDGRTMVYEDARPRQRLHRVRLDGSDAPAFEPILATTHTDRDADFSPDGSRLAFVSDRSGSFELWLADPDGAEPERLTDTRSDEVARPRWSPDGTSIAFVRSTAAGASVWVVPTSGEARAARRVLERGGNLLLSGWSRDGRSLYVASDLGGVWEALRVGVSDGAITRVAETGALAALESPDGRWLCFSKSVEPGIWRMPLAGGDAELVVPSYDPTFSSSWSLTEKGLLYTEWRDLEIRVCLLDLATLETRPLLETHWSHRPELTLSPAGDQLVLATTDVGGSDLNLVLGMAP